MPVILYYDLIFHDVPRIIINRDISEFLKI
jgi:hypothetical protein